MVYVHILNQFVDYPAGALEPSLISAVAHWQGLREHTRFWGFDRRVYSVVRVGLSFRDFNAADVSKRNCSDSA